MKNTSKEKKEKINHIINESRKLRKLIKDKENKLNSRIQRKKREKERELQEQKKRRMQKKLRNRGLRKAGILIGSLLFPPLLAAAPLDDLGSMVESYADMFEGISSVMEVSADVIENLSLVLDMPDLQDVYDSVKGASEFSSGLSDISFDTLTELNWAELTNLESELAETIKTASSISV